MKRISSRWLVPCIALMTCVSAFAGDSIPAESEAASPNSANPASVNCKTLKGNLQILETGSGQVGICAFGKASIEEWTLFRRGIGSTIPRAIAVYANHEPFRNDNISGNAMIANPAAVYCRQVGGKNQTLMDSSGTPKKTLCKFGDGIGPLGSENDGSAIEQWTLFYGPNVERNVQLTHVLGINRAAPGISR